MPAFPSLPLPSPWWTPGLVLSLHGRPLYSVQAPAPPPATLINCSPSPLRELFPPSSYLPVHQK